MNVIPHPSKPITKEDHEHSLRLLEQAGAHSKEELEELKKAIQS